MGCGTPLYISFKHPQLAGDFYRGKTTNKNPTKNPTKAQKKSTSFWIDSFPFLSTFFCGDDTVLYYRNDILTTTNKNNRTRMSIYPYQPS